MAFFLPTSCQQLIAVIGKDWNSPEASLKCFEKKEGRWQKVLGPFPAILGKKGLAWGIGHHISGEGPIKEEGDLKAPIGLFSLGPLFGKKAYEKQFDLPYMVINEHHVWVDDPASSYYNQLIDVQKTKEKDWNSAEEMALPSGLYDVGLFIAHNAPKAVPGKGSCIFMHQKGNPSGTAGCTSLAWDALIQVLAFLKREKNPLLLQLPQDLFERSPFIFLE